MTANLDLAESRQLYMRGLERLAELPEVAMLAGRRVGILGCTGLIGSALLEILMRSNASALASNPIKIYGIARRPVYPLQGYRFIAMSVTDRHALDSIPDLDYTVYVAGTASDYLRRPKETLETQIIGLENALSRVGNTSRFVYISSTRVYGRQNSMEPITEETAAQVPPMHLDNLYDSAKRFGESLCLWYARFRDYQAVVARPSNIYGPQVILRSETAITDLIRQAMELRI